jgi:hypothetical protein
VIDLLKEFNGRFVARVRISADQDFKVLGLRRPIKVAAEHLLPVLAIDYTILEFGVFIGIAYNAEGALEFCGGLDGGLDARHVGFVHDSIRLPYGKAAHEPLGREFVETGSIGECKERRRFACHLR